ARVEALRTRRDQRRHRHARSRRGRSRRHREGQRMNDSLLHRDSFYIDGQWTRPAGAERLEVVSPASEAVIGDLPLATTADIDRAVSAARTAFERGAWPRMSQPERSALLARAAEELRKRTADITAVTVEEMGCAISQAPRSQTGLVAPVFDYYAGL